MSIFRHPIAGGANLVGFYHAQDNYGDPLNGAAAAWKSIGVAYSSDDGKSWRNGGLIVTSSKPRPPDSQAQFGGVGDFGSVWDYVRKQWVMYYGGNHWLSIAISKDPAGRPGTWWKYAGPRKGFTQKGLGGTEFPPGWNQLPDLSMDWARGPRGIAIVPGSNPGMHYNFYLAKWVMIWNSWDGKLYISANADISNPQGWETPRLFATSIDKTKAWHATVISKPGGSAWGGASTRVYYADRWRKPDIRDFVVRTLVFKRLD